MAIIPINLKTGTVGSAEDTIVGIDLGTSNSVVAYMRDGVPVAMRGENGKSSLVPSVLYFDPNGDLVVGDEAKAFFAVAPERTIYSVKRLMGKSLGDLKDHSERLGYKVLGGETEESLLRVRIDDRFYTPVELSGMILQALKRRVEHQMGPAVRKAVITVPAYFNDAQRQATRDAGKLAGWDVLRIINEPTAASLAYGLDAKSEAPQKIAVFDLGGGTFDISILLIEDGVFEVLSTHGDTFLGGDDVDNAIVDFWASNLKDEELKSGFLLGKTGQTMRVLAEKAKKHLGKYQFFEENALGLTFRITALDLENLMEPLVDKTLKACALALKDAKLKVADIDHVVLVGGSTRSPYLQARVRSFFEKESLYDALDPDEVVALGAAVQADILAGKRGDMLLLDVTPLSLGIETVGGLMDVIIPRNAKIPTRLARNYTTSVDGQRNLKVAVFQGERDLVADNRKLGEFVLSNIPPMPAGLPKIEIQFMLDADGILVVRASELRSGTEQQIQIKSAYGISEEEMGMMLLGSIQNAKEDIALRALIEARNEAQHVVQSAQKFIMQNRTWLSVEDVQRIMDLSSVLTKMTDGEDKDAIHRAMDALNTFTAPLAHKALDLHIGKAMKGSDLDFDF